MASRLHFTFFSLILGFGIITNLGTGVLAAAAQENAKKDTAKETSKPTAEAAAETIADLATDSPAKTYCTKTLRGLPGPTDDKQVKIACETVAQLENCESVDKQPIVHYERAGSDKKGKRILALSLIHGDELPSGSVTRAWMTRLQTIEPRNTWRVLPVVNPDGVKAKTRYNSNKVDLNRNFPSKDWESGAIAYWEATTKKDPRRYPGPTAASEPETKCLIQHINEFKPDFIISIHTPLGVLDFDGPQVHNPGFKPLPWVGLGNYVGSLGRYMWVDNKTPVLTIELKGNKGLNRLEEFDHLQDISGTVAIQAGRLLTTETKTK
jgi:protein MpaA